MSASTVTVFGGSGYLGRAVAARLLQAGLRVRVAARAPKRAGAGGLTGSWEAVAADVRDPAAVSNAVAGADAVVNAVGLYVERGGATFDAVHAEGAGRVAREAARAGVGTLVHVSGIGADLQSPSKYVRARAQGERRVRERFPAAFIVRPSVLFGPGDAFLNTLDAISRITPVFPLFGRGDTRLQPVFVADVAGAVASIIDTGPAGGGVCELGGPDVFTYREIVTRVLRHRGRKRLLLALPFPLWSLQARVLGLLPNPPLTVDQVTLMRDDNVVGDGVLTLKDLGVCPSALQPLLAACLPPAPVNPPKRP